MHGDLHPGNVFISNDGKNFILFDVGIVAEYNDSDHKAIVDILAAFIRKQGRISGRLMIDDSNSRLLAAGDHALDEERFIDKIEALTIAAKQKGYFMQHLGQYISYICKAAADHHVMLNPSFVSAALAIKVQEGIALALDPSIDIYKVAIPVIVESESRRKLSETSKKYGIDRVIGSIFGKSQ
jgi:predicted unusual protein kinase regulating ubiquinone biosynthesis (AarF/ABC1/UbiB family)